MKKATTPSANTNDSPPSMRFLAFLSCSMASLCLSARTSDALLANPSTSTPGAPTRNKYESNGSWKNTIVAPLHAAGVDPRDRMEHDGGGSKNGLFDSVGNLFHHFLFSDNNNNNTMPSIIPSISIPNLPKSMKPPALPNIMPVIISALSSSAKDGQSNEKYHRVNDFDADLARDIEEALRLANNNNLVTERGSGDAMTIDDSSRWESNDQSSLFQGNNLEMPGQYRGGKGDDVLGKDTARPSLFGENNAADRNSENLKRGKQKRESSKAATTRSSNGDCHANVREEKPSLFRENNAADLTRTESNRANSPNRNENYINAADVKQREAGQGQLGDTASGTGLIPRKPESFVDIVDIKSQTEKRAGGYPFLDASKPKARDSTAYVDAVHTDVKGGGASLPFYSSNIPLPPTLDDGRKMDKDTDKIASPDGYARKSNGYTPNSDHIQGDFGRDENVGINPAPQSTAAEIMLARIRGKKAQDTYRMYKEYFEGSIVDSNIAATHSVQQKQDSRKIFVTEQAHELARSLKLDIHEIFRYKKHGLDLDDGHGNNGLETTGTMVNENDVREYLDRRYEQLFSKLSADEYGSGSRAPRLPPSREPSVNSSTRKGKDYPERNYYRHRMEDNDYDLRRARDEYYDHQEKNEDAHGWRRSRLRRYASEERSQSRQPSHRQQGMKWQRESFDWYQTNNSASPSRPSLDGDTYNQLSGDSSYRGTGWVDGRKVHRRTKFIRGQTMPSTNSPVDDIKHGRRISPIASVPLSQLVSNPSSERNKRPTQHAEKSINLSNSQEIFGEERHSPNAAYHDDPSRLGHRPPLRERGPNTFQSSPVLAVTRSKFQGPHQMRKNDKAIKGSMDETSRCYYGRPGNIMKEDTAYFAPNTQHGKLNNSSDNNLAA